MEGNSNFKYDFRELSGVGFRVKDRRVARILTKLKGDKSSADFIRKYNLMVSASTLNNWLNSEYGMPFEVVIDILGWEKFEELRINTLFSGRAGAHSSATLPLSPNIYLLYLIGAIIGDGSLRHESGKSYFESYFVSFEIGDKKVISLIRKVFRRVFGLNQPIRLIRRKDGRRSYLLKYSNKLVYYFLQKFFSLEPRKSKTVGISNTDHLSRPEKLSLLLGLYHTDGSFCGGALRFYTSSKKLKNDLRKVLMSIGYASTVYTYQRKQYSPEYQICVRSPKNLLFELRSVETELSRNQFKRVLLKAPYSRVT